MTLAQRITAIRKSQKLSQEKFGELFNVSQRTVAFWEAGARAPSYSVLTEIADKCGVTVDYLLGRSDTPAPEPTAKKPAAEDDGLMESTIERIKSLPEPVLLKLLDLLDAVQGYQSSGSAPPAPAGPSSGSDPS